MAYWWVNQNQTYEQEVKGGYMWSPKKNRNGAKNQFYDNMTLVQPGDLVFSFRKQKISDIGVIQATGHSSVKPTEFGSIGENWSNEGWLVRVNWFQLTGPITPKRHIDQLLPTLPTKYSPLSVKGDGLQSVYLAAVPEAMSSVLISKMNLNDQNLIAKADKLIFGDTEVQDELEDQIQLEIEQNTEIDRTVIQALVKARKGQGRYRRNLELIETGCRLTGVEDKRLLRASHIKPWRCCENNHERLDGNNGLLLTPNADLLFDQGYISFQDDGRLLVSAQIHFDDLNAMNIDIGKPINAGPFNEHQKAYLKFHRENIFTV
ncbi:HNH endonuclease [Methylophaga sp.]|uniref:HNH endonuclease n=1 Tax=Methylophaga sp. TaxID=2024840 RepID=UPI003A8E7F3D